MYFKRGSVPVHPRFRRFARVFPEKRLELKGLKAPKFVHNYEFGEDGKRIVVVKLPILKIMDS